MRYCLVYPPSNKQVDFANKRDLMDWISTHRPFFNDCNSRFWFLHRAQKPKFSSRPFVRCDKICSLKDFIVKHKLM